MKELAKVKVKFKKEILEVFKEVTKVLSLTKL